MHFSIFSIFFQIGKFRRMSDDGSYDENDTEITSNNTNVNKNSENLHDHHQFVYNCIRGENFEPTSSGWFTGFFAFAFSSPFLQIFAVFFAAVSIAVHSYSRTCSMNNLPTMSGKLVLFIGVHSEIGSKSVREMVRNGAHVIATTHLKAHESFTKSITSDLNLSKEGTSGSIKFLKFNSSSLMEVTNFANKFETDYFGKSLDVLILNNVGTVSSFSKTIDGFESQIQENYLAYFLLVKLLMSKIKFSGTRVLTVTSLGHKVSYDGGIAFDQLTSNKNFHPIQAYGQSKLAKILFSKELAVRLRGTNATSNSFNPGSIFSTELDRHLKEAQRVHGHKFVHGAVFKSMLYLIDQFADNSNSSACNLVDAASSPKFNGISGQYFKSYNSQMPSSKYTDDKFLRQKLWDWAEEVLYNALVYSALFVY